MTFVSQLIQVFRILCVFFRSNKCLSRYTFKILISVGHQIIFIYTIKILQVQDHGTDVYHSSVFSYNQRIQVT